MFRRLLLCVVICCALSSCDQPPSVLSAEVQFFSADHYPERLSAWRLLAPTTSALQVAAEGYVYDLNTALFTDYALKLRILYVPDGANAVYHSQDTFDLPTGSIIAKTFFYAKDENGAVRLDAHWDGNPASLDVSSIRLVETRLLVKQAAGWDALPYVWRGNDAYLSITGELITLPVAGAEDLTYLVPSRNQCAGCHAENHTTGDLLPIGIKARHLNRPDPVHGTNQLQALYQRGQLLGLPDPADSLAFSTVPANARWGDDSIPVEHRARTYLDINCGHCHNRAGAADTSGLLLDYQFHESGELGICKPPIAAGRGSGGFMYDIVPGSADHSILTFRMRATSPATMMPELGRTLVHEEGVKLVADWINSMQGACR